MDPPIEGGLHPHVYGVNYNQRRLLNELLPQRLEKSSGFSSPKSSKFVGDRPQLEYGRPQPTNPELSLDWMAFMNRTPGIK